MYVQTLACNEGDLNFRLIFVALALPPYKSFFFFVYLRDVANCYIL